MLPDMGPHAAFIWTSYGLVAGVLGGLIAWLMWDGRRQAAALAQIETRARSSGMPRTY
jgi:heme exporter protein D